MEAMTVEQVIGELIKLGDRHGQNTKVLWCSYSREEAEYITSVEYRENRVYLVGEK